MALTVRDAKIKVAAFENSVSDELTAPSIHFDDNVVASVRTIKNIDGKLIISNEIVDENWFTLDISEVLNAIKNENNNDEDVLYFYCPSVKGMYEVKDIVHNVGNWGDGDGDYDEVVFICSKEKIKRG